MKVDESRWKWMKVDESGWQFGWKWMKVDVTDIWVIWLMHDWYMTDADADALERTIVPRTVIFKPWLLEMPCPLHKITLIFSYWYVDQTRPYWQMYLSLLTNTMYLCTLVQNVPCNAAFFGLISLYKVTSKNSMWQQKIVSSCNLSSSRTPPTCEHEALMNFAKSWG